MGDFTRNKAVRSAEKAKLKVNGKAKLKVNGKAKSLTETQKAEIRASSDYQTSLTKGKAFVAEEEALINQVWARLGELVDGLTTKYGEGTLKLFAEDLGISVCTLERRRSVFRAWKGISAPAPISSAVMQELQAVPDRAEIIAENPNLTKREARALRQERSKGKPQAGQADLFDDPLTKDSDNSDSAKDDDWSAKDTRRWFKDVVLRANDAVRDGETVGRKVRPDVLRQETHPELLSILRHGAYAWLKLAAFLDQLHDEQRPIHWTDDEEVNAAVAQAEREGAEAAARLAGH